MQIEGSQMPCKSCFSRLAPLHEVLYLDGSWKLFLRVTWDGVAAERMSYRRQAVTVSV